MTKKEAVQILAILKAAYPSSYNGMTKEEASGTVAVWAMQFADMPVDIVMMAIQKMISCSKFPPSISEVKQKIQSIHWEAYEALSSYPMRDLISEDEKKQYQRIYESTKGYKMDRMAEPSISQMLPGGDRGLYLSSGG